MLLAAGRSVSTEISSHEVLLFIICFALGGAVVVILLPKMMQSQAQSRCSILTAFEQKLIQVEWLGAHREISISLARPLLSRSVPVKLHAVAIRVAKVNCLTHSVIGSSFERNARP